MKTVNDYITAEAFVLRDTKKDGEVLGLQINIWGETVLSDMYGNREVIEARMETTQEIYGPYALKSEYPTLVLYI